MNLLLFSNSTNFGEAYFSFPKPYIKEFLGEKLKKCIFIPFAGVTISFNEYEKRIKTQFEEIGHQVVSIHHFENKIGAIEEADVIVIGGGNTYNLLYWLYQYKLLEVIREKVKKGTPYIGWSAGSNVACPTICTTNDMPIIYPQSFNCLNIIPFQINPHFTEATIENHGGETREARILEYLEINRQMKVIGLREGTLIRYVNAKAELLGKNGAKYFQYGEPAKEIPVNSSLDFYFKDKQE